MSMEKKLVVHSETKDGYSEHIFNVSLEYSTPYLAGSFGPIFNVNYDGSEIGFKHLSTKLINGSHFNKSSLCRITLDIGKEGLYYLILKPGHKLQNLITEPPASEIAVDIYYSMDINPATQKFDIPNNRLMYSFLNLSNQSNMTIRAQSDKDDENIYDQLRANPTDMIWRQYFVKRAITPIEELFSDLKTPKKPETKTVNEILTAKEAAEYLRMKKKTLQNLASQGKIKKLKGGKYRLEALNAYLDNAPKKKK